MPFILVLVLAIPVFTNSNSSPGIRELLIWNARSIISQLNSGAMPRTKRVHVEPGKPWLPVLAMPAT
jgi:hypothetical protein